MSRLFLKVKYSNGHDYTLRNIFGKNKIKNNTKMKRLYRIKQRIQVNMIGTAIFSPKVYVLKFDLTVLLAELFGMVCASIYFPSFRYHNSQFLYIIHQVRLE